MSKEGGIEMVMKTLGKVRLAVFWVASVFAFCCWATAVSMATGIWDCGTSWLWFTLGIGFVSLLCYFIFSVIYPEPEEVE